MEATMETEMALGSAPIESAQEPNAAEALLDLMARNPLQREIYLQIIEFCETRRSLAETETMVEGCLGFSLTAQTPFRLIANIVDNGGIDWFEIDEQGNEITEERKEGLTPDEADDLVAGFALETTDAGREAYRRMAPEQRMRDLFNQVPQRLSAYLDIIDFCNEPKSFKAVEAMVRNMDPRILTSSGTQNLQPSYFVDMLERSGGLVWDKGWRATKKGSELANQMRPLLVG